VTTFPPIATSRAWHPLQSAYIVAVRRWALAATLAVPVGLLGCGDTPCQPFGKAPVLVSVTDATTKDELCDATVTIASSAGSQRLSTCPYAGGIGPAPFRVTVEKAGYTSVTIDGVTVERPDNQCPAQTKLALKLDPAT
jgi:hypothetical protein